MISRTRVDDTVSFIDGDNKPVKLAAIDKKALDGILSNPNYTFLSTDLKGVDYSGYPEIKILEGEEVAEEAPKVSRDQQIVQAMKAEIDKLRAELDKKAEVVPPVVPPVKDPAKP